MSSPSQFPRLQTHLKPLDPRPQSSAHVCPTSLFWDGAKAGSWSRSPLLQSFNELSFVNQQLLPRAFGGSWQLTWYIIFSQAIIHFIQVFKFLGLQLNIQEFFYGILKWSWFLMVSSSFYFCIWKFNTLFLEGVTYWSYLFMLLLSFILFLNYKAIFLRILKAT